MQTSSPGNASPSPASAKGPRLPVDCGDLDMRIAADGTWFYRGSPIGRLPLAKLFASVLRREPDGRFWLVTPAERGLVAVDDAPFVAVELTAEGEGRDRNLIFRTNLDEIVTAGPEHALRVETAADGEPRPYIVVRSGGSTALEALIARPVFYELVDLAAEEEVGGVRRFGVWSGGEFFELGDPGED
ncbi:MAG TPA: DUF1285 domain-containing protein [Stellaceae bacterium]|nr:DUF1285 domain-containing protein [Stellaceae bacterium]